VAELKMGRRAADRWALLCFHGFTAVAELKMAQLSSLRSAIMGFHGFTAVAELKNPVEFAGDLVGGQVSTASLPWPN